MFQLGEIPIARKRHSDEDILKLLREIELKLANGSDVASACRGVGYGPEFIAQAMQDWLAGVGIKPIRIYPGSPWENGYNERFNSTLRREVLNAEWFTSIRQAQIVIETWLKQYNHIRPHQALNMRPPMPETLSESGT